MSVETTGASGEILETLLSMGQEYGLVAVRVRAPFATCQRRIVTRAKEGHLDVDDAMIAKVFELSEDLELTADLELDNVGLSEDDLAERLRPFVSG